MAAQSAFVCQMCDHKSVMWKCQECSIFLCSTCKVKIHPRIKSSDKHRIVCIKDIWKNNEPWYHGKMTRKEAENLLQKYKYMGDGAFLVRESENCIGNYAVDYLKNDEAIHMRILTSDKSGQLKYYTNEEDEWQYMYDSLTDFIEGLKNDPMPTTLDDGSVVKITDPIPKET